jgi:molecular chaperone GrpE
MQFPWTSAKEAAEAAQTQLQALNQEFQNYRRRNADAEQRALETGRAQAAQNFLPVYDNLLRALEQPCQDEAFVTGIRMTLKSLTQALESLNIREIPALGSPFDPNLHEALEHTQDPALGENTVAKVVLTGFYQGDQVLRHALVIVAN